MRGARVKESGRACYHVMSRVVDRRMVIDDGEKEIFGRLMRAMEGFSGVQVVTHATLDNHFHILLHVPEAEYVDDAEFVTRLGCLYAKPMVKRTGKHLAHLRAGGEDEAAEAFKAKYTYRMYDLSEYMKTLKQRFTEGFNKRHGRKGTLWEERYKSLLVQPGDVNATGSHDQMTAVAAVAAYIDLNPVRAAIVKDPKDYRFCGYGESMGGRQDARRGICMVMQSLGVEGDWSCVCERYRQVLYCTGQEGGIDAQGRTLKQGFSPQDVRAVLDSGGKLSIGQALRCRVRYFSDGLVLGSRAYVDEVFRRHRDHFGAKRKDGARPMTGASWCGLCTGRRLRLQVVTLPGGA